MELFVAPLQSDLCFLGLVESPAKTLKKKWFQLFYSSQGATLNLTACVWGLGEWLTGGTLSFPVHRSKSGFPQHIYLCLGREQWWTEWKWFGGKKKKITSLTVWKFVTNWNKICRNVTLGGRKAMKSVKKERSESVCRRRGLWPPVTPSPQGCTCAKNCSHAMFLCKVSVIVLWAITPHFVQERVDSLIQFKRKTLHLIFN